MQRHQVDGSTIAIDVRGEGDPVLLIHGAAGQIEIWAEPMATLAATHRVVAYDRRGHGRSANPTQNCRLHMNDAATLLTHLTTAPATVVGYSSGGSIALMLALEHPELVRSLVLIEPPLHWFRRPSVPVLKMVASAQWQFLHGRDRAGTEAFLAWVYLRRSGGTAWDDAPRELRELVLGNAGALKVELRPHRYTATLDQLSMRAVGACSVPIAYLLGEDSNPIFHRDHRMLVGALPATRTVEVPNATHLLPFEAPEAIVEAVRTASDAAG